MVKGCGITTLLLEITIFFYGNFSPDYHEKQLKTRFDLLVFISKTKHAGKPFEYDSTFRGPKKQRSCTDVKFAVIFMVVLTCWIALGTWGNIEFSEI